MALAMGLGWPSPSPVRGDINPFGLAKPLRGYAAPTGANEMSVSIPSPAFRAGLNSAAANAAARVQTAYFNAYAPLPLSPTGAKGEFSSFGCGSAALR
jgi:hypothetical protein